MEISITMVNRNWCAVSEAIAVYDRMRLLSKQFQRTYSVAQIKLRDPQASEYLHK